MDFGGSPGHDFVYKTYFCDVTNFKKEVELSEYGDLIRNKITIM